MLFLTKMCCFMVRRITLQLFSACFSHLKLRNLILLCNINRDIHNVYMSFIKKYTDWLHSNAIMKIITKSHFVWLYAS